MISAGWLKMGLGVAAGLKFNPAAIFYGLNKRSMVATGGRG
jgi:hypothetical protein